MAEFFSMPKQGVDMEEGTIVRWLKKEGDSVRKGEAIAEIETDKTTMEVESLCDGIIRKIYYEEGETVPCHTPLAFIGSEEDEIPKIMQEQTAEAAAEPARRSAVEPAQKSAAESAAPEQKDASGPDTFLYERHLPSKLPPIPEPAMRNEVPVVYTGRIFATPRARKLAQEEGIDIAQVRGTGTSGRIVEDDVRQALARGLNRPGSLPAVHREEVLPFRGIRKATAKHMMTSLSSMAQASMSADIDASNLVSLRTQLNERYKKDNIKISFLPLILAATARALKEHPGMNVQLRGDGIHRRDYVNLGVAVNTDIGLFVPVLEDADLLSLREIDEKVKQLADKARRGALTTEEMSGGSFTVSNLGMYEIDTFTAINNYPETGILAVSRIADRVVAVNGQPAVRPMMNVCLTYDHRVIDGAPAAAFLTSLRHYLENPVWVLL